MGRPRKYVVEDDRSQEDRRARPYLVGGRDVFMSGWGGAAGGASVALWACAPDDLDRVFAWVKARGDIKRPRVIDAREHFGGVVPFRAMFAGLAHVHVYVVSEGHPATMGSQDPGLRDEQEVK